MLVPLLAHSIHIRGCLVSLIFNVGLFVQSGVDLLRTASGVSGFAVVGNFVGAIALAIQAFLRGSQPIDAIDHPLLIG